MEYLYYINDKQVSRNEFKEELAFLFADVFGEGIARIKVPNYRKAEDKIREFQRTNLGGLITNGKNFIVKKMKRGNE